MEYKNIRIGIVMLIMTILFILAFTELRMERDYIRNERQTYMTKMSECVKEGYTFIVDGTAITKVSDEFITSGFKKYNVAYDDAGKQVIMTTLHPAPHGGGYSGVPFFVFN